MAPEAALKAAVEGSSARSAIAQGEAKRDVPVSSLSGSSGNKKYYALEVLAGQPSLSFEISGGTGDADLYVRYGAVPSSSTYDCRPYKSGNAEVCTFTNPQAGTWYVLLNAYLWQGCLGFPIR